MSDTATVSTAIGSQDKRHFVKSKVANLTGRNSRTDERLRSIAFGEGIFVTVGSVGAVMTSKHGVSWKLRSCGTDVR
jgi:hypothetical protein